MTTTWHMITPEFPPGTGGVSGYAEQIASGLRLEGDVVHVWCPTADGPPVLWIHRQPKWLGPRSLKELGRQLDEFPGPRRLLVQWLPHGYGFRTMNLPFCIWLWSRARRGDIVEIVAHEAFLRFREGNWKQDCAAFVHRLMTIILLRAAERVWMSTPAWEPMWRPYCFGRQISFIWLPIPSNIPVAGRREDVSAVRQRYAPAGQTILGHFGTYGQHIGGILQQVLPPLLRGRPDKIFLLLGRDGDAFQRDFIARWPELAHQVFAPGTLQTAEVSSHLSACSLLLQPYPDGVTTRRTSVMAGMAHGVPVVTTSGELTEALWIESGAVAMTPAGEWGQFVQEAERLLASPDNLDWVGRRGRELYTERFETSKSITALRGVQEPIAVEARS